MALVRKDIIYTTAEAPKETESSINGSIGKLSIIRDALLREQDRLKLAIDEKKRICFEEIELRKLELEHFCKEALEAKENKEQNLRDSINKLSIASDSLSSSIADKKNELLKVTEEIKDAHRELFSFRRELELSKNLQAEAALDLNSKFLAIKEKESIIDSKVSSLRDRELATEEAISKRVNELNTLHFNLKEKEFELLRKEESLIAKDIYIGKREEELARTIASTMARETNLSKLETELRDKISQYDKDLSFVAEKKKAFEEASLKERDNNLPKRKQS